jgi:hypothetical protein
LDHGANTLNDVLQNVPDGSQVYKWVEATQDFHTDTYSSLAGAWMDGSSGTPSTTTLGARETVFLVNPLAAAYELVFTGETRSQVPPPALSRNRYHYLSGPVPHPATYTDMTGQAPEEGSLFLTWNTGSSLVAECC